MTCKRFSKSRAGGFTLIELSVVLVIIGLLVGGVVVGQSLIEAARIRQQLSQIEQYRTAVIAFKGKFNCLPGDCRNADLMGFIPGGQYAGERDGNGTLEGIYRHNVLSNCSCYQYAGETAVFWRDLSTAQLISQEFVTATSSSVPAGFITGAGFDLYLPRAKINRAFVVYAYANYDMSYHNYLGITDPVIMTGSAGGNVARLQSNATLQVSLAYAMDQKSDDGMPMTGKVVAHYVGTSSGLGQWVGATNTNATVGSSSTCYDNNNTAGAIQQYSIAQNGGGGRNCAISFRILQ